MQSCPWQGLSEYGPPNVKWCEERLCAWISEPANTWSNLAYIFAAAFITLVAGRGLLAPSSDDKSPQLLRWFAPVMAIMGACSFIYHASNVYVTQMLDFLGMYLFCFLLLGLNVVRLGALSKSRFSTFFVSSVVGTTVLTSVLARFSVPIQGLVSILTLGIVVTELWVYRRERRSLGKAPYSLSAFGLSFAVLLTAGTCSALDVSRKWCDAKNHFIQGHAMWHVLSATSLLIAFYHYRQFRKQL